MPASEPLTALLVETDDLLRRSLSRHLLGFGVRLLTARDTDGALLAWEQSPAPVELLITNVLLPKMGGPVLARHLRARSPRLKVIYISSMPLQTLINQGVLEPGAIGLTRSCSPQEIAAALQASVSG